MNISTSCCDPWLTEHAKDPKNLVSFEAIDGYRYGWMQDETGDKEIKQYKPRIILNAK